MRKRPIVDEVAERRTGVVGRDGYSNVVEVAVCQFGTSSSTDTFHVVLIYLGEVWGTGPGGSRAAPWPSSSSSARASASARNRWNDRRENGSMPR